MKEIEFSADKLVRLEYNRIIPLYKPFNYEATGKDHNWWSYFLSIGMKKPNVFTDL